MESTITQAKLDRLQEKFNQKVKQGVALGLIPTANVGNVCFELDYPISSSHPEKGVAISIESWPTFEHRILTTSVIPVELRKHFIFDGDDRW